MFRFSADVTDQELGDAIRTEHRTRRRSRLAAAVGDERRTGVQLHISSSLRPSVSSRLPQPYYQIRRFREEKRDGYRKENSF